MFFPAARPSHGAGDWHAAPDTLAAGLFRPSPGHAGLSRGPKVGLGMWNSLPLTLLVEFGLFLTGLLVYLRTTRSKGGRSYGFWSFALFLAVVYAASLLG